MNQLCILLVYSLVKIKSNFRIITLDYGETKIHRPHDLSNTYILMYSIISEKHIHCCYFSSFFVSKLIGETLKIFMSNI
jgi:hypothetical protein